MAVTIPLTDNFDLGMVSDIAPTRLKPNAAVSMRNFIPNRLGVGLALRQGFEQSYLAHADMTFFSASTTGITATVVSPFIDTAKLVMVDQSGRILSINTSGVGSLLSGTGLGEGAGGVPVFFRDNLILLGSTGTKFPWKVTTNGSGTASAATQVDPYPKATVGAAWGAYLLLANGGDPASAYAINNRRLWFSDSSALTFTTANASWWDFHRMDQISAVAPIGNAILVFSPRQLELLTGTTPPVVGATVPSGDLAWRPLYPYGAPSASAVKYWNGYVMFANERGLFKTDGTQLVDLTEKAGLLNAWRGDFYNFGGGSTCALGIFQNYAFITVTSGIGGTETFGWCFDLVNEIGFRFTGFPTVMYAESELGSHASTFASEQDLVFGLIANAQAGRMQPVFDPSTGAGSDWNSIVIPFELITPFYRLGSDADKRFRRTYLTYDWDNTSPFTETPSISYSVTNDPYGSTVWNAMTFPPSGKRREPVMVNDKGRWIAYKISGGTGVGVKQLGIYGFSQEGHVRSGSRAS